MIFANLFRKKEKPHPHQDKGCNFGHNEFNKTKRSKLFVEEMNLIKKGQNPRGGPKSTTTTTTYGGTTTTSTSTTSTTTVTPDTSAVVLLDFNGYTVSNTSWNVFGSIVCDYSGLSDVEIEEVVASIQEDYAAYNVTITTDEDVFNAAP